MKLNKTLMMAALMAGTLLTGSFAVQAQDASTNNTPPATRPGRARGGFDMISKQLALTDDQKTKAKPIFDEMQKQLVDLRNDTTVASADKRAKVKDIRSAATAKLKDILTAEQLAKWEKMGAANRRPAAATPPAATTPPATDSTK